LDMYFLNLISGSVWVKVISINFLLFGSNVKKVLVKSCTMILFKSALKYLDN
jgi:hypothetical protein